MLFRLSVLLALAALPIASAVADDAAEEGLDLFERRIRPVLVEHCYECHSAESDPVQGGLRVDARQRMLKGGDSGPALAPRDLDASLQLAADLIVPEDDEAQVALGFIGLGPKYYRRRSPEVMADEWEDRVDTVGRGLLGLTLACARCHDHKYDPVSTEDYYALAGAWLMILSLEDPAVP